MFLEDYSIWFNVNDFFHLQLAFAMEYTFAMREK